MKRYSEYFIEESDTGLEVNSSAKAALNFLLLLLTKRPTWRSSRISEADHTTILQAALAAFGEGNKEMAYQLTETLETEEKCIKSFQEIVERYFDIEIEDMENFW